MSKVVVNNSLTLDGVMQAPGRLDEDLRGGFEHGGWAQPYFDSVMGSVAAEGMAKGATCCSGDGPTRILPPSGPTKRRTPHSPQS
jgi:hypothetical protein